METLQNQENWEVMHGEEGVEERKNLEKVDSVWDSDLGDGLWKELVIKGRANWAVQSRPSPWW